MKALHARYITVHAFNDHRDDRTKVTHTLCSFHYLGIIVFYGPCRIFLQLPGFVIRFYLEIAKEMDVCR